MLDERLVFLDLETTGGSPLRDRVTEVALVVMERGRVVDEWQSLVNPGVPIPPDISAMTGITNRMVADAPSFAALADKLAARLGDAVLVAHNARFDHGFLKAEFGRLDMSLFLPTLCTVRLSRALDPELRGHGLDALIERYHLQGEDRHRAMGDTRLLVSLVKAFEARHGEDATRRAMLALLRRPSLPANLPADALTRLPTGPGVYVFRDAVGHPLYVGKSVNLRERVGSHFSSDWLSERDLRLSRELSDIECIETAGELGALLMESRMVKALMPAHNVKLRLRTQLCVIELDAGKPRIRKAAELDLSRFDSYYGIFGSRKSARETLASVSGDARLCWKLLGLERAKPPGPCFARQLHKCAGACVGEDPPEAHAERLAEALSSWRLPAWRAEGPVAVVEGEGPGCRSDWHVFDRWCYLGTTHGIADARQLAAGEAARSFDVDAYRLLRAALDAGRVALEPL
jgi:DNA polymerase-3 subunit epsilon